MSSFNIKATSSQLQSSKTAFRDLNGEGLDFVAEGTIQLAWNEPQERVIINASSDFTQLSGIRGALLRLKEEFFTTAHQESIIIHGDKRQLFERRLFLLEHEIDGLLKRRIHFSVKEGDNGRVLDFTGILNQKQNQIVQLEKKIQNFEQRLLREGKRVNELQNEIVRLSSAIKVLNTPNASKIDLDKLLIGVVEYQLLEEKLKKLRVQFGTVGGLIRTQFDRLRSQGVKLQHQSSLNQLLNGEGIEISQINGIANIIDYKQKVVQVPVQDSRTKHLIHMFAVQLKKYVEKYPKLRQECDVRLTQFFQQQIIDLLQSDDFQRVVSIVKYVPQFYRVENVYAYSSGKSRKVEFHLRVLIKALLQELQKIKRRTGAVLDIDQGVIGMINQEIMGVIEVDDILKVFRVVPKIVQVQKIVEKIVERVVEVPQVIAIERVVEKIVEVVKVQQVQKIVHVPIEIIKYVDNVIEKVVEVINYTQRIVEVPRIVEKIVERIVEIPKIVQIQVVVERIVQVEKPIIVQKIVNHTVIEIREVEVIRQKLVPVQKIIREVVEVQVIREKIVQKIVQIIKPFDRIVQKAVEVIKYRNAREVVNHVVEVPQTVSVFVQKLVPVVRTVQKIVEVPQIIEKIVQVHVEVPTIKQVKVIEEKIVYRDRIKQIEKIVNQPVILYKQVQKIVDRRVEVPFYQQKIVRVPEIITQIVLQRVQIPKIVQVIKTVEKIVQINKIIQVQKPVNYYINQNIPVKVIVQKIVEVPRTVQRIKEVRVYIDKIIEKMVEVPKVVEVEKIVEKIVVVPRVIEKIVEVPQIVERIVDRIVQIEKIRQVQKLVNVPIVQEKIVQVQVIKNIYHNQDRIVQKIIEKIVPLEKLVQTVKIVKEQVEKIVQVRIEIPKEITVQKISPKIYEIQKIIQIQKHTVVPVQIPVPIDRIVEKVIVVQKEVERVVQVVQQIEKVVQVRTQDVRIEEVVKIVEKAVMRQTIKEVEKIVPYIQQSIKEVKVTITQPAIEIKQKITEVPTIVQKLFIVTNQIPNIYQVQRWSDKIVQVPMLIQLPVQVPIIVSINQIVQAIRQRPIEIPIIHQQIKEVHTIEQKIVAVERNNSQVKEVVVNRDKIVEKDRLVIRDNTKNYIQSKIQTVERYQQKIVPVISTIEKIVQIPYILQKIVEKIVIMPQVVQVIKYVHQIVEESGLGLALGADITTQEIRYKELYATLRAHFEKLLIQLRRIKNQTPTLKIQIEVIQTFLIQLDKLIQFPRFIEVVKQKIVQVQVSKSVLIPTKDASSIRNQVALSLLVQKLISEIRNIKKSNPNIKLCLEQDLQLIFFSEAFTNGKLNTDLNSQLTSYKESQYNQFLALGSTWTNDHDLIINTVLQERFTLANTVKNANLQIEKSKAIANQRLEGYRGLRKTFVLVQNKLENLEREFGIVLNHFENNPSITNEFASLFGDISQLRKILLVDPRTLRSQEPIQILGQINGSEQGYMRLQSAFRTLQKENELLRDKYIRWQKEIPNASIIEDKQRIINSLTRQFTDLSSEISALRSQPVANISVNSNTQQFEIKIRTLNSRIQQLQSQIRTQKVDYEGQIRVKNSTIRELEDKLLNFSNLKGDDSRITGTNYGTNYGTNSNVDKLTSSVHSNSSGTGTSQGVSSYVSGSNISSTSNPNTTVTRPYGTTGLSTGNAYNTNTGNTGVNYGTSGTYNTANTNNYSLSNSQSNTGSSNQTSSSTTGYASTYKPNTYGSGVTGAIGATSATSLAESGTGIGGATYGTTAQGGNYAYGAGGSSSSGTGYGATYGTSGSYGQTGGAKYGVSGSGSIGLGLSGTSGLSGASGVSGASGLSGVSNISSTGGASSSGQSGSSGSFSGSSTPGSGYTSYTSYYNKK